MEYDNDDRLRGTDERDRMRSSGFGQIFDRLRSDEKAFRENVDRNARALAQSALSKLDVVSRAEFDAQATVLQRTRERVAELETQLQQLTELIESRES